jgi:hypothetical protein
VVAVTAPEEPPKQAPKRWWRKRLVLVAGTATAILGAVVNQIAVGGIMGVINGPTLPEELRTLVNQERHDGRVRTADVTVPLAVDRTFRVMVFRATDGNRSDELVITEERGDDLDERLRFEPAPYRRPASGKLVPYRIAVEEVADLVGSRGEEQVLLSFSGAQVYLNHPVVAWWDDIAERVKLDAPLGSDFVVGPADDGAELRGSQVRGIQLVHKLYDKPTVIKDVDGRQPPLRSRGAYSFELVDHRAALMLAAGFVVREDPIVIESDQDSAVATCAFAAAEAAAKGQGFGCVGTALATGPAPGWINVKLWRFDRQGVRPSTTYCGGRRTIVRAARDSAAAGGLRRGVVPFETAAGLNGDGLQHLVDRQLTGMSALC